MRDEPEREVRVNIPEGLLSLTNFPDLSAIQKSLKPAFEYRERMQAVLKDLQPAINMALEAHKQYQKYQHLNAPLTRDVVIPHHRPVEYDILDELRDLNDNQREIIQNQQKILALREDGIDCLLYDAVDGSLSRVLAGKNYSYDMTSDGKRKQMFEILFRARKYVNTKDIKVELKCPSNQAVSKIAQTFNDYADNTLRLNGEKLIQGKKGSGYRLNPKITIESNRNY